MNGPRDHHFIPVFYLKRWTKNGKLVEYSRPYSKIVAKPVGPKATGYQTDLYTFPELPEPTRHILESGFFSQTDQLASDALDQLYSRNTHWTPERRSAWSRFIVNFRIRHPDPLQEIRAYIRATWGKSDPYYEAQYAEARQRTDPETFADYIASLSSEATQKIQLRLLHSVLDNDRLGARINNMIWGVRNLSEAKHTLLTSDWPADLILAKGMLSLPVGPRSLFVAATSEHVMRQLREADPNKIVVETNKYVVSRARRYVYACDHSQTSFVEKYMSKAMDPQPIWPALGQSHREDAAREGMQLPPE